MSDCCTCTNDSNARLLAEIEKIRKWLGAGDKIEVPEHLLSDKAAIHRDNFDLNKKVELESFAQILEWYLGNLSGWMGEWGRHVKTKKLVAKQKVEKIDGVDVVKVEYTEEEVGIDLPDIATSFEVLLAMLLDMQDDNARSIQSSYAATVEAHQARQQATMSNYAAQCLIDIIGGFVKVEEIKKDLPSMLSFPSTDEMRRLAEKPYEQQIERLLQPSNIPIRVSQLKGDSPTLTESLMKLLDAATIIRGAFTMPVGKGESPMEIAKKLKKLVADGYLGGKEMAERFEANCELAERAYGVGFVDDPWYDSYENRPKIRNQKRIEADQGIGGSI